MPRHKGSGVLAWSDPAGIDSASGEQRLLAALIRLTIGDARAGDADAATWLINDALQWLVYVVPVHCDAGDAHEKIKRLAGVEKPSGHAG